MVNRYLKVLKSPEHSGIIEPRTVDEIFFMVPDILEIHEKFLAELRNRLDNWDAQQKVGDAFMETVGSCLFSFPLLTLIVLHLIVLLFFSCLVFKT